MRSPISSIAMASPDCCGEGNHIRRDATTSSPSSSAVTAALLDFADLDRQPGDGLESESDSKIGHLPDMTDVDAALKHTLVLDRERLNSSFCLDFDGR